MAPSFCLFAAQCSEPGHRAALERRARDLAGFYRPLGHGEASLRWVPSLRLLLGTVDARTCDQAATLSWGGPAPPRLLEPAALLAASDSDLRAVDAVTVLAAASDERARVVCGAGGIASLYSARGGEASAWSTHAVAAAWLALGRARVDPDTLPELIAFEYVGGPRTLVQGVRALPVATRVDLTARGEQEHSFWPKAERWAPVPEAEASAHAERALLEGLRRRLDGAGAPVVGLTGGLDSRVVAAALRALDVPFQALTWGPADSPELDMARMVAATLGAEHRWRPIDPPDAAGTLSRLDRLARWSDGTCPLDLRGDVWPREGSAFVTGIGGEVGRAFHYMPRAHEEPDPSRRRLRRLLSVPRRLYRARPDVVRRVEGRVDDWLVEAESLGYGGWARLDFLYGEQRLRRWGRLILQQSAPPAVPAFATPEVTRALASLPLVDRVTSGFHRRFLQERLPELAPAGVALPRSPAAARWARRRVAPALRPPLEAVLRRRPPGRGRWPDASLWAGREEVRRRLADEVLRSELVREALGEGWARHTRERFLADEWRATSKTLQAAGAAALADALAQLERDAR